MANRFTKAFEGAMPIALPVGAGWLIGNFVGAFLPNPLDDVAEIIGLAGGVLVSNRIVQKNKQIAYENGQRNPVTKK